MWVPDQGASLRCKIGSDITNSPGVWGQFEATNTGGNISQVVRGKDSNIIYYRNWYDGISPVGWSTVISNSDLARFKTNDFVISKDVAVMALQVNGDTYAKIMKNAVNGKADYGTCIIDYTNGAKTEIKIQNGKMLIDGKEVATK